MEFSNTDCRRSTDLMLSATLAKKPYFPSMSPLGGKGRLPFECLGDLRVGGNGPESDADACTGYGFEYLAQLNCCEKYHVQAFRDLADYSKTLQAFCNGQLPHVEVIQILDSRNEITHRVLSLPTGAELAEAGDGAANDSNAAERTSADGSYSCIYDCCRMTAVLYTLTVAFPIRRSQYARNLLVQALMEGLLSMDPFAIDASFGGNGCGSLFLWCLVVGGCCAGGLEPDSLEGWYMDTIVLLSAHYELETWNALKEILRGFAWLDVACDRAAQRFWTAAWERIGVETD